MHVANVLIFETQLGLAALEVQLPFGLGLHHDAKDALGFVLRYPGMHPRRRRLGTGG